MESSFEIEVLLYFHPTPALLHVLSRLLLSCNPGYVPGTREALLLPLREHLVPALLLR